MELQVKYGQSIYDLAILTGYTIDRVYEFIQLNPEITSINFDFDLRAGMILVYEKQTAPPPQLSQVKTAALNPLQSFYILDQQNIFDLVTQTYGGIENAYRFIQDNGISNINEQSLAGKTATFNTNYVSDLGFLNTLTNKGLKIATGIVVKQTNEKYRIIQDGTPRVIETGDLRLVN